jgi:hypothetical protein
MIIFERCIGEMLMSNLATEDPKVLLISNSEIL